MSIALAIITDGRGEYLEQTIASLDENTVCDFSPAFILDDSGDGEYAAWLDGRFRFPSFHHGGRRQGLSAAVRDAWASVIADPETEFVFHLEEDFTFNKLIDIDAMAEVLSADPELAQIVLKRQPVSPPEHDAGGWIEAAERDGKGFEEWTCTEPALSTSREIGTVTTHSHIFSFNPCLIPRRVIELVLSKTTRTHESDATAVLLDAGYHFGVWGAKYDPPLVHHIGEHRSAGYQL